MFAIYGTTYGAGNGSTTFNLPDFRNRTIWGANSFGYLSAGLPNITGTIGGLEQGTASGAFTIADDRKLGNDGADCNLRKATLNASRSNSIYGNSNTVQPPAVKVRVVTRYK